MVLLVEYLDTIARQKARDVLYVDFEPSLGGNAERSAWKCLPVRAQLMEWFSDQGIEIQAAVFVSDDVLLITPPYHGEFYIDVPYDADDPRCQLVLQHMEKSDGSSKVPGAKLCFLPLSVAEKYAYRDSPGFIDDMI